MKVSGEFCGELFRLAREHNGRNVRVAIDEMEVLIVQRAEDADRVLRQNVANYPKNLAWFRQILGASRLTEEGEAWRVRQALTQRYFNSFDRQRCLEISLAHAQTAVAKLLIDSAEGALVINEDVLHELTVNIMMENFFGVGLSETTIDLQALAGLIEFGSVYALKRPGSSDRLPRERLLKLPSLRKAVLQGFNVFRRDPLSANEMIAGMLELDGDQSSDFILEHELVTFFIGGSEAPASALGWASYLLALHPRLQDQLRQALEPYWAIETPTAAQLGELTPLSNFVSETLRLYPPVPALARLSLADDRLGDARVDTGQHVAISVIGLQYDRRFRPDPWALDISGVAREVPAAGSLTAFGSGPRMCGGKQFALLESMAILSVFLRSARFELISDSTPEFYWRSQMNRRGGHPVRVLPLTNAIAARRP
jgi:enediyne biosynthesis protein E7